MKTHVIAGPFCLIIIVVSLLVSLVESCVHDDSVRATQLEYLAQKAFDAKCSGTSIKDVKDQGLSLFLDCGVSHAKEKIFTRQESMIIDWAQNKPGPWDCAVSRGGEATCKGSKKWQKMRRSKSK
jgi:hypothetical protein